MAENGSKTTRTERKRRKRKDLGRTFARLLCVIFGLIGLVPLGGGLLLRSPPLQEWSAAETSRILREQLGVEASFEVEMSLIPLRLAVKNLRVPATDGGAPALSTGLVAVSPRFFSLLAGRIDVGDVELEDSSVRLVIRDGKIRNVAYRFPETPDGKRPELERSPFRSLAVTNARVELDIDGTYIRTEGIDIDAFAEPNLSFDVAVRSEGAVVQSTREMDQGVAYDEDRLCALELRVFLDKESETIDVRRLSVLGGLDLDPAVGTRPSCEQLDEKNPRTVALRLSQFEVDLSELPIPRLRGHVMLRGPAQLANRYSPLKQQFRGWAGFSGEVAYDGTSKLPEINGQLRGGGIGMDRYTFAKTLRGTLRITGDVVQVPEMHAEYANGRTKIEQLRIAPFEQGVPIEIRRIHSKDVDFPGLMRDIGVTDHTIVDWNLGDTVVSSVGGKLSPLYVDGRLQADTHDFVVWNRAWHDPTRKRMIGVKQASLDGRFRVHSKALEFYDTSTRFGGSSLPIDLVSIGFKNALVVDLAEDSVLDLADVSPVAGMEVAGIAQLDVEMRGPAPHPVLQGKLSVADLMIGGFETGNLEEANVHFEPLFVDFTDARGSKGDMSYRLPRARLQFGGPAGVEFTASVASDRFVIRRFFEIFGFDEDPRFAEVSGVGSTQARVRYVLGGPEDGCETGRLYVDGRSTMSELSLFGEGYHEAEGDFSFEWFDMLAGANGLRLFVPSVTLRKGTGSVFGSVEVWPGGRMDGNFVATRLPVSKVDALGELVASADGFVTGSGHLGGTLDSMAFTADVDVTQLEAGDATLPPSRLAIRLEPNDTSSPASTGEFSGCGRPVTPPFDPASYSEDESDGTYFVSGSLFGGQVELDDVSLTRQRDAVMSGKARLDELDLGALARFLPGGTAAGIDGALSGDVDIERLYLQRPFDSDVTIEVSQAELAASGFAVRLADPRAQLRMADGSFSSQNLALAAETPGGQRGVIDVDFSVDRNLELEGDLRLRPTTLAVLAPALPGVERADGRLAAQLSFRGPVAAPRLTGKVSVDDGEIGFAGLATPVTDLDLTLVLRGRRLAVERGRANWGGGQVQLSGSAPLTGTTLGRAELTARTRGVTLPVSPDIRVSFDSDLVLTIPASGEGEGTRRLPLLSGEVDLLSASYEKPMNITADLASLAARGNKSEVEAYDESDDALEFDVVVRSTRPIEVSNNLVETELSIDPSGLRITGTNQRPGAVGTVEVPSGGLIFLRQSEFEIQRGLVRFSDPTEIEPEVDVTAVTDFRRYEDRGTTGGATGAGSGAPVAGNWRIVLHAYGEPEDLQIDLSSDPPLAQDDIFLLLAVGLTRTELEQTQNSGAGSSVALEALGSLSGAESAVTGAVPIDEFRFGSTWSSRTGRTEPTVTIGKRLSERIRASVTTSLSDANEVRSNVEYRATRNLSVEGSYDNAQDSGTTSIGNIGGDIRWRLEFE